MEPLTLTCAALQILGSAAAAIKLSVLLYKKIKTFRHFSEQVKSLLVVVSCQNVIYHNQVYLLLQYAQQDDGVIESMLADTEHPQWSSKGLRVGIDHMLGNCSDTCLNIMEQIRSVLSSMSKKLSCFDKFAEKRQRGESMKSVIRRLRQKIDVTCDISGIHREVTNFRDLNTDLRRLIEGAVKIKEQKWHILHPALHSNAKRPSQEYGSIAVIKRASMDLHQVLAKTWRESLMSDCFEESKHNVKLFLDAHADQEVQMEVFITCIGQCLKKQLYLQLAEVRLRVESGPIDSIEPDPQTQLDSTDSDNNSRKRPKVRFADAEPESDCSARNKTAKRTTTEKSAAPPDLGQAGMFCMALHVINHAQHHLPKCLGYLDNRDETPSLRHRHKFFPASASTPSLGRAPAVSFPSMQQLLGLPAESSLTIVDQLKLARNFVMAVLKFHSTPWLPDYFSIKDVSFLHSETSTLAECLQTVHFIASLVQQPLESDSAIDMSDGSGGEDEAAVNHAKLNHGVHNETLWSLGTALLQIGNWSVIERPNDVVSVRQLAQRSCKLGKRYKELTEQCIECNFAFGNDLSKPRLQQAVYETVACRLAEMIRSLDIGDQSE